MIENEEMIDTHAGKLGLGGLWTLMEIQHHLGNSLCLLHIDGRGRGMLANVSGFSVESSLRMKSF